MILHRLRFLTQNGGAHSAAAGSFALLLNGSSCDNEVSAPVAGLGSAAHNLAVDLMRAQRIRPTIEPIEDYESVLVDPVSDPARIAEARQRLRVLANGIDTLPARCREVFFLHRFEGLTQTEISFRLGISVKAVEANFARAILYLRRLWST